jgi:P27 family predicted phage terminase small subunit
VAVKQNEKRGRYKKKSVRNKMVTDSVLSLLVKNNATEKPKENKADKLPQPPADLLDAVGVEEWKRVVGLLSAMGLVTELDVTTLILYCDAYSDFAQAVKEMKKTQRDIIKTGNQRGGQYRNPWYDVKKKAAAEMNQYSTMLGLSPLDRAKMRGATSLPNDAPENPFDAI